MAEEIDNSSNIELPMCINVHRVDFNDVFFQEEALTPSAIGWISQAFKIYPPSIHISFDELQNRYVFDVSTKEKSV
jgi:hypothetical protein